MMRHLLFAGTLIVFSGLIVAPSAAQPTIAWHPISSTGPFTIEGHTIAIPEGGPGIEVTLEIMVSGWGDAPGNPEVGAYQATLDATSLSNGSGSDLAIKGWPESPDDGYFYDETRPDRLCPACPVGGCIDPWSIAWGCIIILGGPPVVDDGGLYYGGTLILEIPAGADGTYTIEFNPADTKTFLFDEFGSRILPLLRGPGLIVVLNDCNNNGVSDLEDIAEGTSQDCNGNLVPDECDIADGIVPDVNGNGIPDWCEAAVLYVDADATGLNNGTSWTDAFNDLQDALQIAANPSYPITDIWVAAGTYPPGSTSEESFQLINGVGIYGGFAGTETARYQRDPDVHITTLSGDLIEGNSYHVVTTGDTDATAVLDGCTITGGDCFGGGENPCGGGVYNADGSPTLANCTITGNWATWGGGMCSEAGSPTLVDCTFHNNGALINGGGMHNSNSSSTLVNCTFIGHQLMLEDGCGGGMYNHDSALTLVNCMFSGNRAGLFGGLGGGMYHASSFPTTLVNCTFSGNTAYPWLLNNGGGGIHTTGLINLKNCVLWGNTGGEGVEAQIFPPTTPIIEYSCIQDWPDPGTGGNIDADPLFVDPDGPDDIVGTLDDELHLSAGSPCIDAGDNTAVPPEVTTDLDGNPRFVDDPDTPDTGNGVPPIVDLGAYEVEMVDCNRNGVPDHEDIAQGASQDCNGNGIPDECEVGEVIIRQLPDEGDGVFSDADCDYQGGPVILAEDFILSEARTIGSIVLWGGYFPDSQPGTGDDFTVIFHADAAGLPGATIAAETNVPTTRVATGRTVFGLDEYLITLLLANPVALGPGTYHAEVFENTMGNTDCFFWQTGGLDPNGSIAGMAYALEAPGTGWTREIYNLACEVISLSDNDCNANRVPDECDLADGTSFDCNTNDIPDECEDDCNGNGLADECDIAEGTSQDNNGNGIPDECEARMNRYIWFAPQNAENAAFRVEMTASTYFPDSLGVLGWVGAPDTNDISRVVAVPFFNDSWPALVNVADCEIVPVATYEIRPSPDGSSLGDPIITATILEPSPKKWADVVGTFTGTAWTRPNGTVNMDDVMAGVQAFKRLAGAPHWTWIDLDEEVPNAVVNFTDIVRIVQGFKGESYPFSDPANCP